MLLVIYWEGSAAIPHSQLSTANPRISISILCQSWTETAQAHRTIPVLPCLQLPLASINSSYSFLDPHTWRSWSWDPSYHLEVKKIKIKGIVKYIQKTASIYLHNSVVWFTAKKKLPLWSDVLRSMGKLNIKYSSWEGSKDYSREDP